MTSGFGDTRSSVSLSLVIALDEFGQEVLDQIETHIKALPLAAQHAIRLVPSPSTPETISQFRADLSDARNTDAIRELGWLVAGRSAGVIRIRYWLLWDCDTSGELPTAITELQTSDPSAEFCGVRRERVHYDRTTIDPNISLMIATEQLNTGETIQREDLVGSLAGLVLASLLPTFPGSTLSTPGTISTAGFAGFYGIVGPARTQLSHWIARKLLKDHLQTDPLAGNPVLPPPITEILELASPRRLCVSLFDARWVEGLGRSGIPAAPRWDGDKFRADLNEAAIALSLEEIDERDWALRLGEYSRGFDMTIAYEWKTILERTAPKLSSALIEAVSPRMDALLNQTAYSPGAVRRTLEEMSSQIEEKRVPAGSTNGDLETALRDLASAVESRPNALALGLRLGLWVLPALIVGAMILSHLYDGIRGTVFPVVWMVASGGLAAAWFLLRIQSAHRRVLQSRNDAISVMVGRQEAILAENALGYLDEILVALRVEIDRWSVQLESYRSVLEGALETLHARLEEPLAGSMTLGPVLRSPEEYEVLFGKSVLSPQEWIQSAAEGGALARLGEGGRDHDTLSSEFVSWVETRLGEASPGIQIPGYGELWEIRRDVRKASQAVEDAFQILFERAVPPASEPLGIEQRLFGVHRDIWSKTEETLERNPDLQGATAFEVKEIPILFCMRAAAFLGGNVEP